jgi:putative oxidoreductase
VGIKDYLRWIQRMASVVGIMMAAWGGLILLTQPVTRWFATSSAVWLLLLVASLLWLLRGSLTALAATSLSAATVGRLFSTVSIGAANTEAGTSPSDLLLQVETGHGIPDFGYVALALAALLFAQFFLRALDSIQSSTGEREILVQSWALTFLRLYAGLMFVPHFVGHIFAGRHQFVIYTQYFAGLHLPLPAAQLVLAGTVEVIVAIGLTFGICTRAVALLGTAYLILTMLLGGHFTIGYVWILPNGGYEFGVFWAALCATFIVVGGGRVSLDRAVRGTGIHQGWIWPAGARWLFA